MSNTKAYPTYWQSIGLLFIIFLCSIVAGLFTLPFLSFKNDLAKILIYVGGMGGAVAAGYSARGSWRINVNYVSMIIILIAFLLILSFQILTEPLTNLLSTP